MHFVGGQDEPGFGMRLQGFDQTVHFSPPGNERELRHRATEHHARGQRSDGLRHAARGRAVGHGLRSQRPDQRLHEGAGHAQRGDRGIDLDELDRLGAVANQPGDLAGQRRPVAQAGEIDLGIAGFGDQGIGQAPPAHRTQREHEYRVDEPLRRRTLGVDDRPDDSDLTLRDHREHLRIQVRLGVKVAIDAARRHAGAMSDQCDLGSLSTALSHELARSIENSLLGP